MENRPARRNGAFRAGGLRKMLQNWSAASRIVLRLRLRLRIDAFGASLLMPRNDRASLLGSQPAAPIRQRESPYALFAWAWTQVMAMTPTMSAALQPRERSLTGAAMPWVMGP